MEAKQMTAVRLAEIKIMAAPISVTAELLGHIAWLRQQNETQRYRIAQLERHKALQDEEERDTVIKCTRHRNAVGITMDTCTVRNSMTSSDIQKFIDSLEDERDRRRADEDFEDDFDEECAGKGERE